MSPYEGESTVRGSFDGFVDCVRRFLSQLKSYGQIQTFESRATSFSDRTASGKDLDQLRSQALHLIETLVTPKLPAHGDDAEFIRRPAAIQQRFKTEQQELVAMLRTGDSLQWHLPGLAAALKAAFTRWFNAAEFNGVREFLSAVDKLHGEQDSDGIWGCWLMQQCGAASTPGDFKSLVSRFTDLHVETIKATARLIHSEQGPGARKTRVSYSYADKDPQLRYGDRVFHIPTGKEKSLLDSLFNAHKSGREANFKEIHRELYPGERYEPDESGGPPAKLRKVVQRLNESMGDNLGQPADGAKWICTRSRASYYLNDSVVWQDKTEWGRYPTWSRSVATVQHDGDYMGVEGRKDRRSNDDDRE